MSNAIREYIVKFKTKVENSQLKNLNSDLEKTQKNVSKLEVGFVSTRNSLSRLGIAFGGLAISLAAIRKGFRLADQLSQSAQESQTLANSVGLSVKELNNLRNAFLNVGIRTDKADNIITSLVSKFEQLSAGGENAQNVIRDFAKLGLDDLARQVVDPFSNITEFDFIRDFFKQVSELDIDAPVLRARLSEILPQANTVARQQGRQLAVLLQNQEEARNLSFEFNQDTINELIELRKVTQEFRVDVLKALQPLIKGLSRLTRSAIDRPNRSRALLKFAFDVINPFSGFASNRKFLDEAMQRPRETTRDQIDRVRNINLEITNNLNVEGNATPDTAKQIGQEVEDSNKFLRDILNRILDNNVDDE